MPKTLALIHTAPVIIPLFTDLCRREMPGVDLFHMLDESLLKNTLRDGTFTRQTARRLAGMIRSAEEAGAAAVLVTCSSIGEGVAPARELVDIPVVRVDEAMAEEAVQTGTRIGVAATLASTLEPTCRLLEQTAQRLGAGREIIAALCEGAFEAVSAGDTAAHDRIVLERLRELMRQVDAVVLAQASMARVAESIPESERRAPVLSSPLSAVRRAKSALGLTEENHS